MDLDGGLIYLGKEPARRPNHRSGRDRERDVGRRRLPLWRQGMKRDRHGSVPRIHEDEPGSGGFARDGGHDHPIRRGRNR